MKKILIVLSLLALFMVGCGNTSVSISTSTVKTTSVTSAAVKTATKTTPSAIIKPAPSLTLENYDGGFFKFNKPAGWDVMTAGAYSTFAVCAVDKNNAANRIFYFGEVGPVYLAKSQKTVDQNYMNMGGYPVTWFEMPVIDPLTPENFLVNFHLVAKTNIAQKFMPGLPELSDIEIISTTEKTTFIISGQTRIIRALFKQGGQLGEGLFLVTVAPLIPLTGMPAGGIGYGFCFTGITAVRENFKFFESKLQESLNTLSFSQKYIDDGLALQRQQGAAALDLGKTLSETSDIIMNGWESRNRSDDILAEKRSDMILGNSRVYDPETGTVYDVPPGFYDNYNINRNKYKMDNLQILPQDDWNLWTASTEPGTEIN